MKSELRLLAITAWALSLAPSLRAEDTAKPALLAEKTAAVNFSTAFPGLAEAQPAAASPTPQSAPARPQSTRSYPSTPKVELFLGYSFLDGIPASRGNRLAWLHGGSTSLAFNFNRHLGLVADFGGLHADRFGPNAPPSGGVVSASGNVFTYMLGPRISFRHKITPFAQALFGGVHATDVTISGCSGTGCTPLPAENAFAMTAGGGLDLTLRRHLALRLIQAEYLMTRFTDRSTLTGTTAIQNDVRISTGIVFRFGGNPPPPPPPANHPPVASCSADRTTVLAQSGDIVIVRVQASDPDNDPLTYTWTATGGAVEGSGPEVRWNSADLAPGAYTARVRVDDGRGGTADCSVEARVEARPNRPPTIACSANPSTVPPGGSSQISCQGQSLDNRQLTYKHEASAGAITPNGANATLSSQGAQTGPITVTSTVTDDRNLTANTQTTVTVEAPPPPPLAASKINQIEFPSQQKPSRVDNTAKAILDDVALRLQREPDSRLVIVGSQDATERRKNLSAERALNAKAYLTKEKGIDPSRIDVRSGGTGGKVAEFWIVPAGATYQGSEPTVSEKR